MLEDLLQINIRLNELEKERTSLILKTVELKRKQEVEFLKNLGSSVGEFFKTPADPDGLFYLYVKALDNFRNFLECVIIEYQFNSDIKNVTHDQISIQTFLDYGLIKCTKEEFVEQLNSNLSETLKLLK